MGSVSDAARGLYSALIDKGFLSYGAARIFYGPELAAIIPDPLDLTDRSWLPGIGHASDMGRTQGIHIKPQTSKIELKTADDGERAADKAIQAQTWMIESSLADAGIVKLSQTVQGIEIERHANNKIKRIVLPDRTYQRDSQVLHPLLVRIYRDGVLSRIPLDNLLFFAGAPSTEDGDQAYTSGDQRVYPVSVLIYKSLDFTFTDNGVEVPLHGTSMAWGESESEV